MTLLNFRHPQKAFLSGFELLLWDDLRQKFACSGTMISGDASIFCLKNVEVTDGYLPESSEWMSLKCKKQSKKFKGDAHR